MLNKHDLVKITEPTGLKHYYGPIFTIDQFKYTLNDNGYSLKFGHNIKGKYFLLIRRPIKLHNGNTFVIEYSGQWDDDLGDISNGYFRNDNNLRSYISNNWNDKIYRQAHQDSEDEFNDLCHFCEVDELQPAFNSALARTHTEVLSAIQYHHDHILNSLSYKQIHELERTDHDFAFEDKVIKANKDWPF